MLIPWPAVFKAIPWTQVATAAPAILEQARKLVGKVRQKDTGSAPVDSSASPPPQVNPFLTVDARLSHVEERIEEISGEALSSAELLKSLAEQNAQLVQAMELLSLKLRRYILIVVISALLVCGLVLASVLLRP
jgi:hypothetical protein